MSSEEHFFIKPGYNSRSEATYFDDRPYAGGDVIHQPHAYALAKRLAELYGADTIVDIGCGSARKAMEIEGFRKIGVDYGINLEYCRTNFPGEVWIEANLDKATTLPIDKSVLRRSIVICADVIEHLLNPRNLLTLLRGLLDDACAVVITTPERDLVRGYDDFGPPANPSHIREWNAAEFESFLKASDLIPTFVGLTLNNNVDREKKTILAVVDRAVQASRLRPPEDFRPLAIVSSFNDVDIVCQTTSKLLDDGFDVHVLDNWSSDGTFEKLQWLSRSYPGLSLERFPDSGPCKYYEARRIFERKDEIALRYPGRWIVHHDSDEIRCAPWAACTFREALYQVESMGFNAIDFTVCEFRPTGAGLDTDQDPERAFCHFEFGRLPGHFVQIKVWRQGDSSVRLASFGGHNADLGDRKVFPYKFLLKHYPLRSSEHARRKIFLERKGRFAPDERAIGWHIQYDHWKEQDEFIWSSSDLIEFDERETRSKFLVELISGIGII